MNTTINRGYSLFAGLVFFVSGVVNAQAKLVLNGGIVTITDSAALLIDNPDYTAITRNASGYIRSEGPNNRVVWSIGSGSGNNYLVPFGDAAGYLPLSFTATAGSGTPGQIIFSTYATPTWKNSDNLPPGVTSLSSNGVDNSAKVVDRFWQIRPRGYTVAPTLHQLAFTYSDAAYAAPNTINETQLVAQRWNSVLNSWDDYIPLSAVNPAANSVTVSGIAGNQLYNWWTLADLSSALPVTLLNFTAVALNGQVITTWQTSAEKNSDHFEVWKSSTDLIFGYAGSVPAAGNSSSPINYSYTDMHPYAATSYYKLKSVDKDGHFSWSKVVSVRLNDASRRFLFPSPAHDFISINSSRDLLTDVSVVYLYDNKGSLLQTFTLQSPNQVVSTASLAAGAYQFVITRNKQQQTLRFIKK